MEQSLSALERTLEKEKEREGGAFTDDVIMYEVLYFFLSAHIPEKNAQTSLTSAGGAREGRRSRRKASWRAPGLPWPARRRGSCAATSGGYFFPGMTRVY